MKPLKPQDVLLLAKLAVREGDAADPTFKSLAKEIGLSSGEVFAAVGRARHAGLLGSSWKVRREPLLEFLVHGVKYVFAPAANGLTRGIPTAHAAEPLVRELAR